MAKDEATKISSDPLIGAPSAAPSDPLTDIPSDAIVIETSDARSQAKGKQKHFTVECNCPTPLSENPCTLTAVNEADALEQFKQRNGITDTDHPITVTPGTGS